MTNVSHTPQPGSAPDDQNDWTEEDHAAQIAREVEEEVANLEGEVADLDLLRELILQKLTFAFKGESAEKSDAPATEAPKKPRGRPLGSKNKPKTATPPEKPAPPPERDAGTAHLDPAETAEARKAAAPDDVPTPESAAADQVASDPVAESSAPSPEPEPDLSIPNWLRRDQPADQPGAA